MALIKCEECGQMVSDKAASCPHCGCPLEDNNFISENNLDNSYQSTNQDDNSWEEDNEPKDKKLWILLAIAALLVIGSVLAWFFYLRTPNEVVESEEILIDTVPEMIAPVIELDEKGMYDLDDCPTTYDGIEVMRHYASDGRLTSVVIQINGETTQTFNYDTPFNSFKDVIHYLDANFDGYVDFMIGTGGDLVESVLFLWSPTDDKFIQATVEGEEIISGAGSFDYSFCPGIQKIYSDAYSDYDVQYILGWQGNNLQIEESFTQIFTPSMYFGDYVHRYNIADAKSDKLIFSSNDPKKIPDRWKKMARVLTPQEEAEYAESYEEETYEEPSEEPCVGDDINEAK